MPQVGTERSVGLTYQGSGQIAFANLTAQQSCTAASVEEKVLALCYILDINLIATIHFRQDATSWSAGPIKAECLGCWREPGAGSREPGAGKPGATHLAGVSSCRQYRRLMRTPCSAILLIAASVIWTPSVEARIRTIR